MAEISRLKSDIFPTGVLLVAGPSSSEQNHCNAQLCIICQKKEQNVKITKPGPGGKAKLKHAATLRQDDVIKRLKLIEDEGIPYVYHNANNFYKSYTHKKVLDVLETKMAKIDDSNEQDDLVQVDFLQHLSERGSCCFYDINVLHL